MRYWLFPARFDDQGAVHDMGVLVIMMMFNVVLFVLGGLLVASDAAHSKYKHAIAFGVFVLAIGAVPPLYPAPKWFHIANLVSTIPAAAIGARLLQFTR